MATAAFPLEIDLCAALSRGIMSILAKEPNAKSAYYIAEEVHAGTAIADFVILKTSRLSREKFAKRPTLSLFDAFVLAELLGGEARRLNTLAARTALRPHTTTVALTKLSKLGVVERTTSGAYRVRDISGYASGHLIAVEAKLTRWSDAIEQAEAYLSFANQAFVALPKSVVASAGTLRKRCQLAGVGLLSVDAKRVQVELDAPTKTTRSAEWLWVLSKTTPHFRPLR